MHKVWMAWNAEYGQGVVAATFAEVEDLAAQVEHNQGYVDVMGALCALGWVFQEVTLTFES